MPATVESQMSTHLVFKAGASKPVFVKNQIVNIFSFVGHLVYVAAI